MKEKMPWLKNRLRELGKTPTALAKSLGIAAPRVYEMIAGRRHMQPNEIAPTAKFLEWSLDEISRHLPKNSIVMVDKATFIAQAPNPEIAAALVRTMVDGAPKPVEIDEVKSMVLDCIIQRFKGRPIAWETIERGLALACFECKQAALSQATI